MNVRRKSNRDGERGAALVEFAIAGVVFLTALFAVIEFGRLLWIHNALTDAARRGARYAVNHTQSDIADAQKMAVYGTTADGATPMVTGLTTDKVKVVYSPGYNVGEGTAQVSIQNYEFKYGLHRPYQSVAGNPRRHWGHTAGHRQRNTPPSILNLHPHGQSAAHSLPPGEATLDLQPPFPGACEHG